MFARPLDPTAFTPPSRPRSAWLSLDLDALAGALDGTRPLAQGAPRIGMAPLRPRRVPASAFVSVARRRPVEPTAPRSGRSAKPATAPQPAMPAGRRPRQLSLVAGSRLPRRHKLMLAAAAAVMALGFLRAGGGHTGTVAGPAPTALAAG